MDLNYLYHRRGKSLMMAANAKCERSRSAHLELAHGYVARIDQVRSDRLPAAA